MGIGDEIMVSGEVERLAAGTKDVYAVCDARGGRAKHRWHYVWDGNPHIARPNQPYTHEIFNHGGARPYIAGKQDMRWLWRKYRPSPGKLYLTKYIDYVKEVSNGYVVFNPDLKPGAPTNKQWPVTYWNELVRSNQHVRWLQIGEGHGVRVPGAKFLKTDTFWHACGALAGARAVVLQEGGLHHAAAALGLRPVVIFGGFISPDCTGYNDHHNLFATDAQYPLGCGMRFACRHCADSMLSITPADVMRQLETALEQ